MTKISADKLHVVSAYHNPLRFGSRERLYRDFAKRVLASGARLTTVEAALHDREHVMGDVGGTHVPVIQHDELWVKENMLNIGFSRLPEDWEYVAWIDGDVEFLRPDWAEETVHQLQHYAIVQMFQTAVDMGPTGEAMRTFNGFGYSYAANLPKFTVSTDYYYGQSMDGQYWHPGYAWAANRRTLDDLGGLIDWSMLGSGDHIMALALIGQVERGVPKGLHANYLNRAVIWQERASTHVMGDLGYVPGTIAHHWHGKKSDRRYNQRWEILKRHGFDPERDIKQNSRGVLVLSRPGERMRADLRRYFRARNEDSIDVE